MNRLAAATIGFGLLVTALYPDSALAERRVALVIGNSAYQNAPALPNPRRDAQSMAAKFKNVGFEVTTVTDVGNLPFKRALREFEEIAASADIVVVYYAGHGIEIGGTNYMIPVDAKLLSERDAKDEAIELDRFVEAVEDSKQLGLIILDACRDNPFLAKMKRPRTAALRGITAGLSIVEPAGKAQRNTLIAYAAKAGSSAEDGQAQHSPYATALLNNLFEPGLELRLALGRVRDEVLKTTGQRQEPYVAGSLGGEAIYLVPAPQLPRAVDSAGARSDYDLVEKIGTKGAWEIFLVQHPTGFYADLARQQLAKFSTVEPSRPPVPPGPSTEEQRAWDRIKDSSNLAVFRDFINRYPSSALANTAQRHLQALERAAQEREEKARAEREAKAAAEARQRAEREAAVKRTEEERRAKAAQEEEARRRAEQERTEQLVEAARQAAKRAEAERLAKQVQQEEARKRAEAAEAERKRLADEEARKRAEAAEAERRQRTEAAEADRRRLEQEAERKRAEAAEAQRKTLEQEEVRKRAEEERRAAELERQKADEEAARKRAEEQRAEEERRKAEQEATRQRMEQERQVRAAERAETERIAALQRADKERGAKETEAACRREGDRLAELKATKDYAKAREELKRLEQELTCERLRASVMAALEKVEKPAPVLQKDSDEERPSRRQRARTEGSRNSAARHRDQEEKPSPRAKREESRPQPRVRQEARTAPVRHSGGGGGGSMVGVGF